MAKITVQFDFANPRLRPALPDLPLQIHRPDGAHVAHIAMGNAIELTPGPYIVFADLPGGEQVGQSIDVKSDTHIIPLFPKLGPPKARRTPRPGSAPPAQRSRPPKRPGYRGVVDNVTLGHGDSPSWADKLNDVVTAVPGVMSQLYAYMMQPLIRLRWRWRGFQALPTALVQASLWAGDPVSIGLRRVDRLPVHYDAATGSGRVEIESGAHALFVRLLYANPAAPSAGKQSPWSHTTAYTIAVPITGRGACVLHLTPADGALDLRVELAHTAADHLLAYLEARKLSSAAVAAQGHALHARQLLESETADPVAAALVGYALLTLSQPGDHLAELRQWLPKLVEIAPWLADAYALYGEQLARDGEHPRALQQFLQMLQRGTPLFTAGVSLALERLSAYANAAEELQLEAAVLGQCRQAQQRLRRFASYLDPAALVTTAVNLPMATQDQRAKIAVAETVGS